MTQDEALHLALEALEKLWNIIDDIDTYSDMAKADEKLYRSLVERRQRQRFEETGISTDGYDLHGGAITAIKAALEAKDEPVAWAMLHDNGHFIDAIHPNEHARVEGEYITPLYTTPPPRTWVGLTEDEAFACKGRDYFETYKAIEAKLKEKNT
jgi:hypothetical protein